MLGVAAIVGIVALIALVIGFRTRPAKPSRMGVVIAVLPAFLMLTLFFSLAIHMHHRLGGWPSSIGEGGFPARLVAHAHAAMNFFSALCLVSIFVWPVAFLLCLFVRGWRGVLFYLGVYALCCCLCFGAMLLAPSQFLNWWWD
jgi:hypothetical protein